MNILNRWGFPTSFFDNKEATDIDRIYDSLYGESIVYMGSETVFLSEIIDSESLPIGEIPEADMELTISKATVVVNDSKLKKTVVKEVKIFVDYVWTGGKPFIQWDGAISVNWDSSVFTVKQNSFSGADHKLSMANNGWITTTTLNNPTLLNQGGLGYYAKLTYSETVMGNAVSALQHKGSTQFSLLPAHSNMYLDSPNNVTSINVEYVHNKTPIFSSVWLSYNGLGVSITLPAMNDSVAKALNFSYSDR